MQAQQEQGSQGLQHIRVPQDGQVEGMAGTASSKTQKVQIVKHMSGKVEVQLVQLPDGGLQILSSQGAAASPLRSGSSAKLLAQGTGDGAQGTGGAAPLPQAQGTGGAAPLPQAQGTG